jgi:apolipoprotein N-acyltransferase
MMVNGLFGEGLISIKKTSSTSKVFRTIPQHLVYFNSGIILLITLHLGGLYLYNLPISTDDSQSLKVGIIQGNIPNTIKLYRRGWEETVKNYTQGYLDLVDRGVEVVLTPEAAFPKRFADIYQTPFYQAVLTKKIPVWLGIFGNAPNGYTQSLYTLMGDGEIYGRYDKIKLVPLGEYIPFKEVVGNFINRLSPLNATLLHGVPNQQFKTPFGTAIAGICYDSAFGDHFRNQAKLGEFILTASNNAHYTAAMPAQHHAQDIMRAIETDRWAVRATNTGYSAIVDPHGHTKWISAINQYAIHSDIIYRQQSQTPYVRWGDWITPWLIVISSICYLSTVKVIPKR